MAYSYKSLLKACLLGLFAVIMLFSAPAFAQQKPKLVSIKLNEETNDATASAIVDKLYQQHIRQNDLEGLIVYGDIYAQFVPLAEEGSDTRFIVAKILEPPLGCYAKGCSTDIYMSTDGKSWRPVWAGYVQNIWYDANSKQNSPANLIMTSNHFNRNPGVWIWNNNTYMLANKRE